MEDKNSFWVKEDEKFINFEKDIKIPKEDLSDVDFVVIRTEEDFNKIPNSKGVYWIWTNEPITHLLHDPSKPLPKKMKLKLSNGEVEGEIIYNGIAQNNIQNRIKKYHLFADKENGISGISIDIFMKAVSSHKKKVFSKKGKVPYIDEKEIRSKEDALKLFLTDEEKDFIKKTSEEKIYFRNGIKILEEKHKEYYFVVFYIGNLKSESFMGYIEKKWRKEYKSYPRLCSYASGR